MFRSHAPRAVVAALTAVVLIAGLMASTTSAAPKPKPTPTPTPTPSPTPTPTPTPNSDNRTVYFGDAPKSEAGEGKLIPSTVTAGNIYEFTLFMENEGAQRLTHAAVGYGSQAVARTGSDPSLPAGASIISATVINGVGSCSVADLGLGALCDLGQFDSGETATIQMIVNAPSVAVVATTYASFKVAENVPDQGANRNTFFADGTLNVGPTNSNSNATYKLGGTFSLSTDGNTLVKKDSMTTTVSGPDGAGAISISEEDCDKSCVGQIATVHVRDGALQTPYLEWTLIIIGSIDGVITHTLDDNSEVQFSGLCATDPDGVDCILSNTKVGNVTTIIFRTATNGKVRAN